MTVLQAILAFMAAATILTITPGLDTAMVLRSAAVGGVRPAAFAAFGICLGCLIWGIVVSLGLGALLAASFVAFTIVKLAGAAYLLWMGVNLVLKPRSSFAAAEEAPGQSDARAAMRRGLWCNLLNPKIGVFYVTFLPQFTPVGHSVGAFSLLLTGIYIVLTMIWFAILIAATAPMAGALRKPKVVGVMDRLTGSIFVGFGVNLALTQRP